jgi:hypothetical protein
MAHYAFLDENNIVTEVITGRNEWEEVDGITDWEKWYGEFRGQKCVRTSYNSRIRYHYAGVGHFYDETRDAFIAPQPYPSWSLDENFDWQPPEARPEDGNLYTWNEETTSWVEVEDL